MGTALRTVRDWHGPLVWFAAGTLALAAACAVAWVLDPRTLAGAPAWAKPLKFSISFTAYALTLAWMISRLRRWRRAAWWAGTALVAASVAELALITLQVVRGRASHFNVATELDTTLFTTMGGLVAVIYTATLVVGAALLRSAGWRGGGEAALTWAVGLGVLIAVGGMSVGFLMLGPTPEQAAAAAAGLPRTTSGAHAVGVADGGPGLPLVGWSTTGGDLRIGHFVGMHALQALPALALVLGAGPGRRLAERTRVRAVLLGAALYGGVVVLTVWQALRGQPLLAPDAATLAAASALAAAGAAGAAVVAVGARRAGHPAGAHGEPAPTGAGR